MLRRQMFWFLPVVIACSVVVDLSEELTDEFHQTELGRVAQITLLIAVMAFAYRAMRPDDGVLSGGAVASLGG
ncbi:MAG: hypothetical protein M2R46_05233 [Verrucomicrobia subdivision 3 bacterium]|nr:hypothetical protein [Limisphaerales bacterium]